jgi:ankyrin repeat protein
MNPSDQPVHKAAQESAGALRALLDREPSLREAPGWFSRRPLHAAAGAGRPDCVALLLQRGAAPNAVDGLHRWTPLHNAVAADSPECVDSLLQAGADPNAADTRGETPIFYAKSLRVVQRLEAAGADLGVLSGRGQYPFQYCAAYIRSPDVLRFWLERGVPLNHVPDFGWPALHAVCARFYGKDETRDYPRDLHLLELLLERGADINLQDKDGNTALYTCCINWHVPLAEFLLRAGADSSVPNRAGDTALHAAVFRGTDDLVRSLLQRGADVNAANRHHQTPYDISKGGSAIRALLAPFHQQQEVPVPTADQVLGRLRAIPAFRHAELRGCTAAEIARLEDHFRVRLPAAYRDFLGRMGKGAGEFLLSDRWTFQFDDLFTLARDDAYAEVCDLPEDYFVFAERDGSAWVFFVADGQSDAPPIYLFTEGEGRSCKQVARSLWEFLEALVVDYELWDEQGFLAEDGPPTR